MLRGPHGTRRARQQAGPTTARSGGPRVFWLFCKRDLGLTGNRRTGQGTIYNVVNMQQHPRPFPSSQTGGPRRPGADGAASDGADRSRRPPGTCAGPTSEPTSIYDLNSYPTQRRTSSGQRPDAAAAGGFTRQRRACSGDPTASRTEGNVGIEAVAHGGSCCDGDWCGREPRRASRVQQTGRRRIRHGTTAPSSEAGGGWPNHRA
jgi:hypothetical protein